MLPEELPLREPLENPPPDPPRAFAKETVGTPTRVKIMDAAMSFVVFKTGFLSIEFTEEPRASYYPTSYGTRKPNFQNRRVVRSGDGRQVSLIEDRALNICCTAITLPLSPMVV